MRRGRTGLVTLALCALATLAAAAATQESDLAAVLSEGFALFDRQDMAAARTLFTDALSRARESGDEWAEAEAQRGLGRIHYRTGRYAEADAALQQALDAFLAQGDRLGAARCVSHLGSLSVALGRPSSNLETAAPVLPGESSVTL